MSNPVFLGCPQKPVPGQCFGNDQNVNRPPELCFYAEHFLGIGHQYSEQSSPYSRGLKDLSPSEPQHPNSSHDRIVDSDTIAMVVTRNRRFWMIAFTAAIPLEFVAASMLRYVPRIGVSRNPNSNLELAGAISASIHAPGLLLSQFLCLKFRISPQTLMPMEILTGYLDLVLVTFLALRLIRWTFSKEQPQTTG